MRIGVACITPAKNNSIATCITVRQTSGDAVICCRYNLPLDPTADLRTPNLPEPRPLNPLPNTQPRLRRPRDRPAQIAGRQPPTQTVLSRRRTDGADD